MRAIIGLAGLLVATAVAWPCPGLGAGSLPPERLGGLDYDDAYDRTSVVIDVLVRDRDGDPVTGLRREQFRLLEDGIEVPISTFAASSDAMLDRREVLPTPGSAAANSDGQGAVIDTGIPIYVVLFIDNRNLRASDRNRVLRPLQELVRKGLGQRTQIMVVTHDEGIETVQPFTDQAAVVVEALRTLRTAEADLDDRDEEQSNVQQQIRRLEKAQHHTPSAQRQESSNVYSNIRTYIDSETAVIEETLSSLSEMLTALSGLDGRTYLIYLSNGLPMAPGAELLHEFAGTDSRMTTGTQSFRHNKRRQYEAIAAAANNQAITIHTIDATGSSRPTRIGDSDSRRSASSAVIARENLQEPLELLARETGGLAALNTDDYTAALERIRSAMVTFYSVGYEVGTSASDSLHQVEITLDSDPDHELVYSSRVVRKSLQSAVQDQVTSGLFFDVDHDPLGLEITTGQYLQAAESLWQLPITLSLPVRSLAMVRDGEGYVSRAVHYIATRDLQTGRTEIQRQDHSFRLTAEEYEQRKDESFPISVRLLFATGQHCIAVGVLDEVTHQTSIKRLQITTP